MSSLKALPVLGLVALAVGIVPAVQKDAPPPLRQMEHLGRGRRRHPPGRRQGVRRAGGCSAPTRTASRSTSTADPATPSRCKLNDRAAREGHLLRGRRGRPDEADRVLRPAGPRRQGAGRRAPRSRCPANAPARPYLSIPLKTPPGTRPNDASVGDLDGDGEYEIVSTRWPRPRTTRRPGTTDRADPRSVQARRHASSGGSTSARTSARGPTTRSSSSTTSTATAGPR